MRVRRGTWTARNAVAVAALAATLAAVVWIQFLAPVGVAAISVNGGGPTFGAVGGDIDAVRSDRPGLRVLFVGNSFTYFNEMPAMVGQLAANDRGARQVFAVRFSPGGARLEQSLRDEGLRRLIAGERWDAVVLQEQSAIPAWPADREAFMFPAARALARMAEDRGAQPVLYMTWGYRAGDQNFSASDSYEAMQARVAAGYRELGGRLGAPVAPVGLAWRRALRERPGAQLWHADGHHPSRAGSYLAASVLYARLTERDPRHSGFTGGLERAEARWLRAVAAAISRRPRRQRGAAPSPARPARGSLVPGP